MKRFRAPSWSRSSPRSPSSVRPTAAWWPVDRMRSGRSSAAVTPGLHADRAVRARHPAPPHPQGGLKAHRDRAPGLLDRLTLVGSVGSGSPTSQSSRPAWTEYRLRQREGPDRSGQARTLFTRSVDGTKGKLHSGEPPSLETLGTPSTSPAPVEPNRSGERVHAWETTARLRPVAESMPFLVGQANRTGLPTAGHPNGARITQRRGNQTHATTGFNELPVAA